jgi:hypothetical protein
LRCAERGAHLDDYETEAAIVSGIFRDYVQRNLSMHQIRGTGRTNVSRWSLAVASAYYIEFATERIAAR